MDTSAVQVNSARFDDRVDALVSERVQNYQGGKQRIGGKKGQQQNKKDNKFRGNKSRNEEQEKLRRPADGGCPEGPADGEDPRGDHRGRAGFPDEEDRR